MPRGWRPRRRGEEKCRSARSRCTAAVLAYLPRLPASTADLFAFPGGRPVLKIGVHSSHRLAFCFFFFTSRWGNLGLTVASCTLSVLSVAPSQCSPYCRCCVCTGALGTRRCCHQHRAPDLFPAAPVPPQSSQKGSRCPPLPPCPRAYPSAEMHSGLSFAPQGAAMGWEAAAEIQPSHCAPLPLL